MVCQVVFTEEPEDICVKIGIEAFFPCTYTGTSASSLWKINGRVYSSARLPVHHRLNSTGLIVDALSSLNMFAYSCLLEVFISGEHIVLESTSGTLTVVGHRTSCIGKYNHFYLHFFANFLNLDTYD